MQKYLRYVIWACLLVVPFLALYVADGGRFDLLNRGTAGMFFPFIAGKNIVFRGLVTVAFFAWALLAIKDARYRLKKTALLVAYSVFIGILLVADYFGVDRMQSFWSNFERMEGFFGHAYLFAYFVVLSAMLKSLEEWRRMFCAFIVANVGVLLVSFGQIAGVKEFFFAKHFPNAALWFAERFQVHMATTRVDATLGNSAYLAIFNLFFIFIAALLFSQTSKRGERIWLGIVAVLNLIVLFYTGTRGTMIGLGAGIFVTLALLAWKGEQTYRKYFLGLILAAVIAVGSIFIGKDTSFVQSSPTLSRIASISLGDVTTMSRLSIWQISYEAWTERPILGYGQDNFSYIFARKFIPEKMWNIEAWYDRSHDVFFDWLVAAGVLGLLSYLSLFVIAAWLTWRKKSAIPFTEKAVLTGAFTGYFLHNVAVFDNLMSYILFVALLVYIAWRSGSESGNHSHKEIVSQDTYAYVVAPLVVILGVIVFYSQVYLPYKVNKTLIVAMDINRLLTTMTPSQAITAQQQAFESAIAMNVAGSREAREQYIQAGVRLAQAGIPSALPDQEKARYVESANAFLTAVRTNIETSYPLFKDDVRQLSIYGVFFNSVRDYTTAQKVLGDAVALAPHKQILVFELIRSYLLSEQPNEAYTLAERVYREAHAFPEGLKWYVMSAIYAKKFEEAKKSLQAAGVSVPLDTDIIVSLVQVGDTKNAMTLLSQYKTAHPEQAAEVDAYIAQIMAPVKK